VGTEESPFFCQYIGDHVLKEQVKLKYPISDTMIIETEEAKLTYEERNGLRNALQGMCQVKKAVLIKASAYLIKK